MWGWLSLVACLSGPLMGLGRLEGLLLRKGRLAVASASRYVWRGVGVVGCRVCWYRRHTLCCLCLVVVGAPACLVRVGVACCRGSGAVRPGCLARASAACWWVVGCGCGWVGCELYSGREHLTVRFLRQHLFVVVFCCLFF